MHAVAAARILSLNLAAVYMILRRTSNGRPRTAARVRNHAVTGRVRADRPAARPVGPCDVRPATARPAPGGGCHASGVLAVVTEGAASARRDVAHRLALSRRAAHVV